jgi:hypothetical protein
MMTYRQWISAQGFPLWKRIAGRMLWWISDQCDYLMMRLGVYW